MKGVTVISAFFRRGRPCGRPGWGPSRAPLRVPALYPSGDLRGCRKDGDISLDIRPYFSYKPPISLIEGRFREAFVKVERVRRLRAGLAIPLPGGFGAPPGRH